MYMNERIHEEPCGCRVDICTGIYTHLCKEHACDCEFESEQEEFSFPPTPNDIPDVPPIAPDDLIIFARERDGSPIVSIIRNGEPKSIRIQFNRWRHSPNGFEWGYGGSGPAELARYLAYGVARHLNWPKESWDNLDYQDLKWKVVAKIPHGGKVIGAQVLYEALGLPTKSQ